MSTTTRRTLDTASVTLPGNREFTASLYRAPDGEPLDLVLQVGFSSDAHGWRHQAGTIALPPSSLREVAEALLALAEAGR